MMAAMDDAPADEILFAPAKLTLSLRIVGARPDGYHLIDAEMVSLDVGDELHMRAGDDLVVIDAISGRTLELGAVEDNLIIRALRMVDQRRSVVVSKRIPAGAGLGGGSADAAAVLRWAGFTDLQRAAGLGADVPFCMVGGRARVSGIGEIIEPLPFVEQVLTLLTPPLSCSTPSVYRAWDELGGPRGEHGNDLEPAALEVAPQLARWRDQLAELSGQRPRLAGSGSTWFVEGSFPGEGRVVVRTTPRS
jgi:4-diphosphocytidyl-2-C-methyl-D-erythritol kinase